jgi:hypothetical protein
MVRQFKLLIRDTTLIKSRAAQSVIVGNSNLIPYFTTFFIRIVTVTIVSPNPDPNPDHSNGQSPHSK